MQGPWYTFEDAEDLLSLKRAELLHRIDTGDIQPVVYTKQRSFLLFQRDANSRWIGAGTCVYRGHLLLHKESIAKLIDDGEIRLKSGTGKLLEPDKVSSITNQYPFQQPAPFGRIYDWSSSLKDISQISNYLATPLPKEGRSMRSYLHELTKSVAANGVQTPEYAQPAVDGELNFYENSLFKAMDLRLAASEIKRFSASLSEVEQAVVQIQEESTKKPFPQLSGDRINQLHQLIFNALSESPDTGPTNLWRVIQEDYESDSTRYDQDSIITAMDAKCINWESKKGTVQTMQWGSFKALLTDLKRKLTEVK